MSSGRLWSWGRYPAWPQSTAAIHWRDEASAVFARTAQQHGTTLAFGSGMSYGDSCLAASDHVLALRPLDRFLQADWHSGVVRAEAGVTLEAVLRAAIPQGWFLAVTPGTRYATLGGAIANDVHGKNHHRRGTFGCHVRQFGLLRSDRGRIVCSPQQESELFAATTGGLGLTGVIEWVELQLVRIQSSRIRCTQQRFDTLADFFALSDSLDQQHEFCVSWIDCMAQGSALGRGIYMAGDFADSGPLAVEQRRHVSVPFTPPLSLVNPLSVRLFNQLYWRRASPARQTTTVGYDGFFYPLDAVLHWNRVYGPRGFQQYQALIPESEARAGIAELLKAVAQSGAGSVPAVLKRCGDHASPGLLSFPRAGITLALDFRHSNSLQPLFDRLDAIVREAGGRLYPAKDAHMSGADFRRMYPQWQQLDALRDPQLLSRFWQRVTI